MASFFYSGGIFRTLSNYQAGGPPLVSCKQMLIQYIRSYPPHLLTEAIRLTLSGPINNPVLTLALLIFPQG